MTAVFEEIMRVFTKLFKLQKIDIPTFFTEGMTRAQQLLSLGVIIFLGVLIVQLVILLVTKKWKNAAVFAATAAGTAAVFFVWLR